MKNTTFALAAFGTSLLTIHSFAQAPSTTTTVVNQGPVPAAASAEVGVSSHDGITVSGASVLITRNGATETLNKELELSNGLRVFPDGTILTRDGGKLRLRFSQVLTFEGKILNAPVKESVVPGSTAVTTTTTAAAPAITVTPGTVVTPPTPTIVGEKPAVTRQAAEEAAEVEAKRRAEALNKGPIKAGEGVQK